MLVDQLDNKINPYPPLKSILPKRFVHDFLNKLGTFSLKNAIISAEVNVSSRFVTFF